jgi:hypothetical protein
MFSPRTEKSSGTFRTRVYLFALIICVVTKCQAYSVLSHEALSDSAWDDAIKPLLLPRFPAASQEELKLAHGYAYGGAVIQDMGYYAFGSKLFSDLVHYVRTGDFIEALLRDSEDLNEYAFSLGALAHYAADNDGLRIATNLAVPILYPKLKKKYGKVVTYDQDPAVHLKTEFGFDVREVAKGRYAPDDYHDRIGFQVAKALLQRAFEQTYCLKFDSTFSDYDLALGTYRRGVSSVIPKMTKVAWQSKKDEIQKDNPGITRKQFLYHLSRASYRKEWNSKYRAPGFSERFLAFLIRVVPKIGPFRALSFRMPTPETEKLFMASFNAALQDYEKLARDQRVSGRVTMENDNFDTGTVTKPGEYPLADKTYADLMDRLAKDHFAQVTPQLRSDLLAYYGNPGAPFATKKDKGMVQGSPGDQRIEGRRYCGGAALRVAHFAQIPPTGSLALLLREWGGIVRHARCLTSYLTAVGTLPNYCQGRSRFPPGSGAHKTAAMRSAPASAPAPADDGSSAMQWSMATSRCIVSFPSVLGNSGT